jgi:hypothetical protein
MKPIIMVSFIVVSIWLVAFPAKAEFTSGLINVDFKFTAAFPQQTGPAVIGVDGDIWNTDSNPFVHTTGILGLAKGIASNGVTYSLSGVTNAVTGQNAFGSSAYQSLMGDGFIVAPGNTMTISFSGLTAFQPYELYFYSSNANPGGTDNRSTIFTIGGVSLTATTLGASNFFVEGNNYVHFASATATAAGQLVAAVQGSGGNPVFDPATLGGIVNGFQIEAVPEPATWLLFAVGAIGVLVSYRLRLN